jgi:hypothetical protein
MQLTAFLLVTEIPGQLATMLWATLYASVTNARNSPVSVENISCYVRLVIGLCLRQNRVKEQIFFFMYDACNLFVCLILGFSIRAKNFSYRKYP